MTNKFSQSHNPDKEETEYTYNYDRFSEISDKLKYPMVESVFLKQSSLINNVWVKKVATLLLRIHSNQTMYDVAISQKPFSSFLLIFDVRFSRLLLDILDSISRNKFLERLYNWIIRQLLVSQIKAIKARSTVSEVPKSTPAKTAHETLTLEPKLSVKNYQDLFQIIYLPTIAYQAEQDKVFAAQRVAGANPLVIEELHSKLKKEFEKLEKSKQLEELKKFKEFSTKIKESTENKLDDRKLEEEEKQLDEFERLEPSEKIKKLLKQKILKEKFLITNEQYKSIMCCNDTLETAFGEHRLYVTDYKVLSDIVPGTLTMEKKKEVEKYIYDPIALFAIEPGKCPNRRLVPIAIQCYQNLSPQGHPNPLFIAPSIESSKEERWAWQIAKLTVQIADANYHEFISHLGGTHLRMEPIAISIYRKLPQIHPLGALLRPHIEGTLFINDAAVRGLVQPGGTVDKVAAGTLESSLLLSVKGAQNYPFSFNDSSLPNTLKERGVENTEYLPNYPYRDDALLIWKAIYDWVSNYLKIFYADDSEDFKIDNDSSLKDWIEGEKKIAVTADPLLQAWIEDLTASEGGQMTGIGQKTGNNPVTIPTLDELIETVTSIVFTGSAQHAAVNFPQSSLMTYMPNMPLAGYQVAPTQTNGISEQDYLNLLPPLDQAEIQMNMTHLLGSVHYTTLGNYGDTYFTDILHGRPVGAEAQELPTKLCSVGTELKKFQVELRAIELEINARNEIRSIHYDFLLPSKIPQSINI